MPYEYKVDSLQAEITDRSVRDGTASKKVVAQIEVKLREWTDKGFEFYRSDVVEVGVKETGCLGLWKTGKSIDIQILVFFFRRQIA